MSIWLVLWIFVSITLLGFLGWSMFTLYRQKAVWKAFSKDYKLRYKQNAFMDSPEASGEIEGYKASLFTGEHLSADLRGTRKLTAIEFTLQSVLPFECAVASGGMIPFIKDLGWKSELRPEYEHWSESYMAAGSSRNALKMYLSEPRLQALVKLMRVQGASVVLICRKEQLLLRLDTPNPLVSSEYLNKLVSLMLKAVKILELSSGEKNALQGEAQRTEFEEVGLVLDDEALEASGGLSLEGEEAQEVEVDKADQEPEADVSEKPETEKE